MSAALPSFGELLKEYRISAGLSQEDLAERSRLSVETISALERRTRHRPYRATVAMLAGALRLSDEKSSELQRAAGRRSALDAPPAHNLPTQISELLGRESDVAEIGHLLNARRLVTVVGTGGIGKTRVALRVASDHLAASGEGVWFVDFSSLANAALVSNTIAAALGAPESPSRPPIESVAAFLKNKQLLLVFDNCEHIVDGAARAADEILRRCPGVRIVATSREALKIGDEQIYRLPSLSVPTQDALRTLDVAAALRYGAIALFIARATAADNRFALVPQNLPVVAEICRRLDGIALAIELAAARVNVLSVTALAERLNERFSVLTAGSRTALPRHRTMRALLDWSYDLLSEPERRLLQRLSVFVGGFTLELATSICAQNEYVAEDDVLELLASLVEKSLVQTDVIEDTARYRLLESTRQYARERLLDRGEHAEAMRAHAGALLAWAERFDSALDLMPDRVRNAQVKPEIENWRAALEWALGPQGDLNAAQRLGGLRGSRWFGHRTDESLRWARAALKTCDDATPAAVRAKLELADARLAGSLGQSQTKMRLAAAQRALALYEQADDQLGIAEAKGLAGLALVQGGRVTEGEAFLASTLSIARSCNAGHLIAHTTAALAVTRCLDGDLVAARALYAEALALFKSAGCARDMSDDTLTLAEIEFQAGNVEEALKLSRDAVDDFLKNNDLVLLAGVFCNCAAYSVALNHFVEARDFAREAMAISHEEQFGICVGWALQHLAAIAVLRTDDSDPERLTELRRAACLLGFAEARFAELQWPRAYTEQQEYDKMLPVLRDELGSEFDELIDRGKRWSEDRAIAEALEI